MDTDVFDQLQSRLAAEGPDGLFAALIVRLTTEKRYHDLFDVLLMRSRRRLGLPVILTTSIDDLDEPLRSQVETEYLAACRQVGTLLLDEGKLREAWMYLRPVGDKRLVGQALARIPATEENLQDMIEIGLHEGVAPALGYALVLKHYGTCNAITTFEGALVGRPRADQQAAAGLLLENVHAELLANVRADIGRQEGQPPPEPTLAELVRERDWLFADNNYHLDTTHLASTVRFSRVLEDRRLLEMAYDLTEYGRRLSRQFQFAGDEPFTDVYPSHGLFFAAQLGRQVDEALAYFRERAQGAGPEQGTAAAEVYVALLARLGRFADAIEASIACLPPGARSSGFAPGLLELALQSGDYERLLAVCRERGDLVSYSAGLAQRAAK
ncbi:MAG: hypothetical protein AB7O59_10015 [Pirellulales bacterium]